MREVAIVGGQVWRRRAGRHRGTKVRIIAPVPETGDGHRWWRAESVTSATTGTKEYREDDLRADFALEQEAVQGAVRDVGEARRRKRFAARARRRFGGKSDEWIVGELEKRLAAAHRETQAAEARAREAAMALLTLWGMEGSECAHGVGIEGDCPGDGEDAECHWQEIRPALRAALATIEGA